MCHGSHHKASVPTLLLINDDFVDFLAEHNATYWNGEKAVEFLTRISKRSELKPVFEGLQAFVAKPGAHLVITLGNHDLELTLPEVRAELVRILMNGVENRRSRIEFAFDGWGYRFRVGQAVALATHGNEVDEYNFTRYDILNQIIHEESLYGRSLAAQGWKPNAGTVFVIDAINRIKKEYPFIDLLKPEVPVAFLALTVLAPSNLAVAEDVGRMKANSSSNEKTRPSSERRFLGSGITADALPAISGKAVGTDAKTYFLEQRVSRYIHDPALNIDDLIYGSDNEAVLGLTDWVQGAKSAISGMIDDGVGRIRSASGWVMDRATEAGKAAHAAAIRAALVPFVETESFDVGTLGTSDKALSKTIRDDYDVVFAGNSHVRRFYARGHGKRGHYVNTGTWAGLMRLIPENLVSNSVFRPIYAIMASGDRKALINSAWVSQERPVAVLERNGKQTKLGLYRVDDKGNVRMPPIWSLSTWLTTTSSNLRSFCGRDFSSC